MASSHFRKCFLCVYCLVLCVDNAERQTESNLLSGGYGFALFVEFDRGLFWFAEAVICDSTRTTQFLGSRFFLDP